MRHKVRIRKSDQGWMVEHPGYGFNPSWTDKPFKTHRAALESVMYANASAGQHAERTTTPDPFTHYYPMFPPVVY